MRSVPTQLDVYECFTPYRAIPDSVIPYDEGMLLVARGQADKCNHGKAIRMRPERNDERYYRNPGGATGTSAMPNAERYLAAKFSGSDREAIFAIDDPTGWGPKPPTMQAN